MKKRVVITGLGILAANGKGRREFSEALQKGTIGYGPVTLFDASRFNVRQAGEVSDFDPKIYMGKKGLRNLDRSTKLLVSAAKLCIDDSHLVIDDSNTDNIGVSVGTTLGSVKSISDFDAVTLKEGPRYTNPALFPNTVINSPASQVSIWHYIKGFNTTISTGFTASTDAMSYAYDFLQYGRAQIVLAGGVEEMCEQTFFGFHALKLLSGCQEGDEFINCPFDRRRNGVTLGEGACLMALEDYDSAQKRGVDILAEVLGFGYSFDPFRIHKFNPKAIGLKQSIRNALKDAQVNVEDIDCIFANANSSPLADRIESLAIREVFGKEVDRIPVTAIKSMTGEGYSVSGALEAGAAICALREQFIPPTVHYREPDPQCQLKEIVTETRKTSLRRVLLITAGPNGTNSCIVLGRFFQDV